MSAFSFISYSKKDKGDAPKRRQNKRLKEMKITSKGEFNQVISWGKLYNKIHKTKKRLKKSMN